MSSYPNEKQMNNECVLRVKGKVLNSFLGFLKTDIARLSFEAFPEHINKQLISIMLLERQDLIWVDISIEKRVATLRTNIFIGENAGNRVFKIGTLCLIGIAHLTEFMKGVRFHHRFECRPFFNNLDLAPRIREELDSCNLDPLVHSIVMNLFHAVKLVASRTLMHIPVAGNLIVAKNGFVGANTIANQELQKSYGIYD